MRDYKPGDIYYRSGLASGTYLKGYLVKKEFTQYWVVQYEIESCEYSRVDIYRLADGYEQLLATIMYLGEPVGLGEKAIFTWVVQSNPWFHMLHKLPKMHLSWLDSFDPYIDAAIDLSEKELEEHFNEVFA